MCVYIYTPIVRMKIRHAASQAAHHHHYCYYYHHHEHHQSLQPTQHRETDLTYKHEPTFAHFCKHYIRGAAFQLAYTKLHAEHTLTFTCQHIQKVMHTYTHTWWISVCSLFRSPSSFRISFLASNNPESTSLRVCTPHKTCVKCRYLCEHHVFVCMSVSKHERVRIFELGGI